MNELEFARQIRQHLEESATRLPYKVTHRLEQARLAALARVPASAQFAPAGTSAQLSLSASGTTGRGPGGLPLWKRTLLGALPVLIVAAGLIAISEWSDMAMDEETADVDAAMLEDDVPIAAYADRGFGVFLKNTGQ